jgi:hypothetical protein
MKWRIALIVHVAVEQTLLDFLLPDDPEVGDVPHDSST